MLASRNRILVAAAMLMSVALIATVVQQSDSGLLREDVSEPSWSPEPLRLMPPESGFDEIADLDDPEENMVASKGEPTLMLTQWSVDRHLHKKQKKLKALDANARPAAVIKNLVELRAVAMLVNHKAQEMIGKSSGNTALPCLLREFGKPEPKYKKPFPEVVDGIEQPVRWHPPQFNIVTFYADAMAKCRKKFHSKIGLNKYTLDNLDSFIVAGHPVVVALENPHFRSSDRRGINKRALGLTLNPNYVMRLSASVEHWYELKEKEWKKAKHADVAKAAHMLKAGAKLAYKSFLQRAKEKEHERMYKAHLKEVEIAKKAIAKKYAKDSDKRTFHNVQMLPAPGRRALEEAKTLVKQKSMNALRKEARDAAAKWVLDKKDSTKNLVVDNIKEVELNDRYKSCRMRNGDRYCYKPGTRIYDVEPCCKSGTISNGKHPCCR